MIDLKDYSTKIQLHTPLSATTYKTYFQALDGNQPKIAETVEMDPHAAQSQHYL